MAMEPCEKHEIINCATCNEQAAAKARRKPAVSDAGAAGRSFRKPDAPAFDGAIIAQFDGTCSTCHQEIVAQYDLITQDPESKQWVHVECP
jgi:Fe-S cluster biogenesis protein NfuA